MPLHSQRVHHSVEFLILFSFPKWYFNDTKNTSLTLHKVNFLFFFFNSSYLFLLWLFLYLIKTAALLHLNNHRHLQPSIFITKSIIFFSKHVFTMWWVVESQKLECHLWFLILLCVIHPHNSQVLSILLFQCPSNLSSAAYLLSIATSWPKTPPFLSWITVSPHIHTCVHIFPACKHRLKNLSQLSKWLEGLWGTSSPACSLVQPSPLITSSQCLSCGQGHSIRSYEESKKLWSLPTDNLDNLVGF